MGKIKNELEKVIYDEVAFNDSVSALCQDIKSQSAKAIENLKKNFGTEITNDVSSLKNFSDEALFKTFVDDARNSYLSAVKFMPDGEKSRINTMYDTLYNTCIDSVKCLQKLFALGYELTYDGLCLTVNADEVSEKIRPNFVINFTDDERQYFTLMANAVNALNEMLAFEKEHGYVQFSFNGINSLSKYGYFRKVNAMSFYQTFSVEHFVDSIKNGTMGKERDI
jgi:hypothetical protein